MLPEMGPPRVHRREWPDSDESWRLEWQSFCESLAGKKSPGASIDDAVAAHVVINAAYREES
jgi:hypothetical protein